MIKEFNKANLKNVREDISAILSKYAKDNGIEIKIGNISFNSGSFSTKMEATVLGAETIDETILKQVMAIKNLSRTSKCGKTLVGYNTRAGKYPFVFESAGKKYKCSEFNAKMYFQV